MLETTTCCHHGHGGRWRWWSPEFLQLIRTGRKRNQGRRAHRYGLRPMMPGCFGCLSNVQPPETRRDPAAKAVHSSGRRNPTEKRNPKMKKTKNGAAPIPLLCWSPEGESPEVKRRRTRLKHECKPPEKRYLPVHGSPTKRRKRQSA